MLSSGTNLDEGEEEEQLPHSPQWKPYPMKTVHPCKNFAHDTSSHTSQMFLLDMLDNLPRLRVSDSLMCVILWILREAGAVNVPSFDGLQKLQKWLRGEIGIPSIPCTSAAGNVFFINNPRAIITQVNSQFFLA
jgi:hypothetical protein